MSNLVIRGKYIASLPQQTFGNDFKVQKFYLDTTDNPEYPSQAEFQVIQDKVNLGMFKKDDEVDVSFNIRGRKVAKKDGSGDVFVQNLEAWKVFKVEGQQQAPPPQTPPTGGNNEDDLPF